MSSTVREPQSPPRRAPIRREARGNSRIEVAGTTRQPAFKAATRHTQRVRVLRILVPVLAVGAIAVFVIATRSGETVEPTTAFDDIALDPEAIVIELPRLTGFQEGGEAYELTAERALQRPDDPNLLALEGVEATFELPGGATAFFAAPRGAYNSVTTFMTLSGGITMRLDTGLEGRLEEMTVDVPNGLLSTHRPFELSTGDLTVRGNALDMNETTIRITGGVSTILRTDGGVTAPMTPVTP